MDVLDCLFVRADEIVPLRSVNNISAFIILSHNFTPALH